MSTTFLKRQKEMKRLEKQREKAERRKQKAAKLNSPDDSFATAGSTESDVASADLAGTTKPESAK